MVYKKPEIIAPRNLGGRADSSGHSDGRRSAADGSELDAGADDDLRAIIDCTPVLDKDFDEARDSANPAFAATDSPSSCVKAM